MTRPSQTIAALLVACAGVALFSLMDAVMKELSLVLGAFSALVARNCIGTIVSGAAYAASRTPAPSRRAMRLHLWRGLVVAAMAVLFFHSVTLLPLAEAIALSFVAPLVALYLAALLLKESIGRHAIIASLIGIVGVAIILSGRMGDGVEHGPRVIEGIASVIASAILFAYNLVLAREQAQIAKPAEIAFFQTLTVLVALLPFAPWFFVWPRVEQLPLLALASILAVTSLHLLSWAYARAEAQILIPVEYSAFVWAAICGRLFFGEALTWPVIAGTVLIVGGCIIAARAKSQPVQIEEAVA